MTQSRNCSRILGKWKNLKSSQNMTDQELMRILNFAGFLRTEFSDTHLNADPDPFWNIVLYLIEADLRQQPVTISQLTSISGIPYTSARRRVERMIRDGDIIYEEDHRRINSNLLHPSEKLWSTFISYAERVKQEFIVTVGQDAGGRSAGAYFGHSAFSKDMRPPQSLIDNLNRLDRPLKIIAHDDNYFYAFQNFWRDYRLPLKDAPEFVLLPLPQLLNEAKLNSNKANPGFDLVSITMPWLPEFAAQGFLKPIDLDVSQVGINVSKFHPAIWSTGLWQNNAYGIPLFSTAEIFAIRSDLFQEQGIEIPRTFDDILRAGSLLHRPEKGVYGIAWNAAEGQSIGTSFLTFMACAGAPILKPLCTNRYYQWEKLTNQEETPILNREIALEVLDFMRKLVDLSPPDILEMDWKRRVESFKLGQTAMTVCASMRTAHFEFDIDTKVARRVSYIGMPTGRGGESINLLGGFLMSIPRHLDKDRTHVALELVAWMAQSASRTIGHNDEYSIIPRFSMADQEKIRITPAANLIAKLERQNRIYIWGRSGRTFNSHIEQVCGKHIHAAMRGDMNHREAIDALEIDFLSKK